MSKPSVLKFEKPCKRCGALMPPGTLANWYNMPRPGAWHHAVGTGCRVNETPKAQPAPAPAPQAPEAPETPKAQPAPAPAGGSLDVTLGAIIEARVRDILATAKVEAGLSRDEVIALVSQYSPVQRLEIKRPDGTEHKVEGEHYLMPRLLKLLGAGIHVALWGPAGTGKTTAALHAARILGRKAELDTMDPSTPKSSILGYRTPTGEPVWTATLRMYSEGGIIVWDEADNAPAGVQTLANSLLANGKAPAAWGMVEKSDEFGFVATCNTPFRPTPAFPDRRPGSQAFVDRLYLMYWPLDPAIESRVAGLPVPTPPKRSDATCSPEAWVTWVRAVRSWAAANAPTLHVTPRASLTGIAALALGETPREVADGLVFRGADDALVNKALAACPLPS